METSSAIVTSEVAPTLGEGPGVFAVEHIFRFGNATEGVPHGDATMEWGGRPWNPTVPMVNCVHLIIR